MFGTFFLLWFFMACIIVQPVWLWFSKIHESVCFLCVKKTNLPQAPLRHRIYRWLVRRRPGTDVLGSRPLLKCKTKKERCGTLELSREKNQPDSMVHHDTPRKKMWQPKSYNSELYWMLLTFNFGLELRLGLRLPMGWNGVAHTWMMHYVTMCFWFRTCFFDSWINMKLQGDCFCLQVQSWCRPENERCFELPGWNLYNTPSMLCSIRSNVGFNSEDSTHARVLLIFCW